MTRKSSTEELIELLVHTYCTDGDAWTRHHFRQALDQLVTIAKTEQFIEMQVEAIRMLGDRVGPVC